jgi:hypothetical protein
LFFHIEKAVGCHLVVKKPGVFVRGENTLPCMVVNVSLRVLPGRGPVDNGKNEAEG